MGGGTLLDLLSVGEVADEENVSDPMFGVL